MYSSRSPNPLSNTANLTLAGEHYARLTFRPFLSGGTLTVGRITHRIVKIRTDDEWHILASEPRTQRHSAPIAILRKPEGWTSVHISHFGREYLLRTSGEKSFRLDSLCDRGQSFDRGRWSDMCRRSSARSMGSSGSIGNTIGRFDTSGMGRAFDMAFSAECPEALPAVVRWAFAVLEHRQWAGCIAPVAPGTAGAIAGTF